MKLIWSFLLLSILSIVKICYGQPPQLPVSIRVGALFEDGEDSMEAAFQHAINMTNQDRGILARTSLSPQAHRIPHGDSFKASKEVCQMTQSGLTALIGPLSSSPAHHVQCMTAQMHVPHIETRYDYSNVLSPYSINIHPHPPVLGKAYADLVRTLGWKQLVILFQDENSLVRLQELLKLSKSFDDIKISLRQLDLHTDDYRPLLKEIKKSQETRIVIDCDFEKIDRILLQAQEIGLVDEYHAYLITNLDVERLELGNLRQNGQPINVNITGFRIVDPSVPGMNKYLKSWNSLYGNGRGKAHPLYTANALIADAVGLYAYAMNDLGNVQPLQFEALNCKGGARWSSGEKLLEYLKGVEFTGLTGEVRFDDHGRRDYFKLDLIEKRRVNMVKTGIWYPDSGVNYTVSVEEQDEMVQLALQNMTLRVVTVVNTPYVMRRPLEGVPEEALERLSFEEKYEGYVIDFMRELVKVCKFKYKFHLSFDGGYGSKNAETGQWNGMIRELLDHTADVAIVDLSMTSVRQEAVDFTMPFMNTGVGILYKKRAPPKPNLFSFLMPLSIDVWVYITTLYLGISILMFLLSRITPYEWESPHPCGTHEGDSETLETQWTFSNALWFGYASYVCAGSDILPKAISTRMLAGMWWFFTLITISSYTANLAAFLTASKMATPVNNAEDLAKQTKIKYGTYCCGSTNGFFRGSTIPTYQKLNAFMESAKPSVYTEGNQAGIDRVRKEDGLYAFFMEAAAIEYHKERICDLTQIGGLLDSKGYGVALPPNSPYTKPISAGILKMQEQGVLQRLKTKWWKEMHGGGKCLSNSGKADSAQMGLAQLGGVFIVLTGGVIVACFAAVGEFLWENRQMTAKGQNVWASCWKEFKFAVDLRAGDTKPVEQEEDSNGSGSNSDDAKSEGHYGVIDEDHKPTIKTHKSDSGYAVFHEPINGKKF